jgi:hypothetical protein
MPAARNVSPDSFWSQTRMNRYSMMLLFKAAEVSDASNASYDLDERIFDNLANRDWLCLYLDEMTCGTSDGLVAENGKTLSLAPFAAVIDPCIIDKMGMPEQISTDTLNQSSMIINKYYKALALNQALTTLLHQIPYIRVLMEGSDQILDMINFSPKKDMIRESIMMTVNKILQSISNNTPNRSQCNYSNNLETMVVSQTPHQRYDSDYSDG